MDGTQVVLYEKPKVDGETYFNRKSRYAINLQLVCDDEKRIRFYQTGWPGSAHDSVVFDRSKIVKEHGKYFGTNQYLLADAGYGLKPFICTPYRNPAAQLPDHNLFNFLFSKARVATEHVNGLLKARWTSLRGIRIKVKHPSDFDRINKWIVSCLILHNFLLKVKDADFPETTESEKSDGVHDRVIELGTIEANQIRRIVEENCLTWHRQPRVVS